MIAGVLQMLLGLGGMFLALGMIVLAVRIGGGTMGTSLRTRDVPPLCCVRLSFDFSLLAEEYRRLSTSLNRGRTDANSVLSKWRAG